MTTGAEFIARVGTNESGLAMIASTLDDLWQQIADLNARTAANDVTIVGLQQQLQQLQGTLDQTIENANAAIARNQQAANAELSAAIELANVRKNYINVLERAATAEVSDAIKAERIACLKLDIAMQQSQLPPSA